MSELALVQIRLLEFLRGEIFSPQTALSEDTDLIASGFTAICTYLGVVRRNWRCRNIQPTIEAKIAIQENLVPRFVAAAVNKSRLV